MRAILCHKIINCKLLTIIITKIYLYPLLLLFLLLFYYCCHYYRHYYIIVIVTVIIIIIIRIKIWQMIIIITKIIIINNKTQQLEFRSYSKWDTEIQFFVRGNGMPTHHRQHCRGVLWSIGAIMAGCFS